MLTHKFEGGSEEKGWPRRSLLHSHIPLSIFRKEEKKEKNEGS